jgi:hypothetical protein
MNTTLDAPTGVLLHVTREEGMYFVRDLIGLRYGYGATYREALVEWADQVEGLIEDSKTMEFGGRLLSEVNAYKDALS